MFIPNKSAPCLALRAVGPQRSSYITLLTLLTTPHSLLLPCSSQWTFAAALLFTTSLHLLPPALQSSHIEKKRKGAGEGWGGGERGEEKKGIFSSESSTAGLGISSTFPCAAAAPRTRGWELRSGSGLPGDGGSGPRRYRHRETTGPGVRLENTGKRILFFFSLSTTMNENGKAGRDLLHARLLLNSSIITFV